ncbi:hypothetical protein RRG08_002995 [Elysia crispata]|uniref:Uncharacterized protein n=1 Tax=Elysia crispata TaxID=231223 RepID=A0AAE1CKF0_9GAST|nr:hypothetical protein RRG08_002995 [Elysia crispata]
MEGERVCGKIWKGGTEVQRVRGRLGDKQTKMREVRSQAWLARVTRVVRPGAECPQPGSRMNVMQHMYKDQTGKAYRITCEIMVCVCWHEVGKLGRVAVPEHCALPLVPRNEIDVYTWISSEL